MNEEGSIEIYLGCMFSGKTNKLINISNKFKSINYQVMNINYILDVRYGKDIVSHDQNNIQSYNVNNLKEIKEKYFDDYQNSQVICINEAQFFPDLEEVVKDFCYTDKKKIFLSGLDGDYQQKPFGQIFNLIPHCEKITKLKAFCNICNNGTYAYFTKRINTKNTQQVFIGGKDEYIPVCRKHLN